MSAILFGLAIVGMIVGGLLSLAFLMATIRAIAGNAKEIWNASEIPIAERRSAKEVYLRKVIREFDVMVNVLVLGGRQCETISTHSGIAANEGKTWGRVMRWWLEMIEPDHCKKAASGDLYWASAEAARMKNLLGIK